jgi:putative aldouronate transport system permease protein
MPYFFSWVVVGYFSFALFNGQYGFVNKSVLAPLGLEEVSWFTEPKYWPYIITSFQIWKSLGYNTVIYIAAIAGIDAELYEAACIDGAKKFKQAIHITLPSLAPIMVILTILAVGRIFNSDFGLFFQTTLNQGALYPATSVIDTYVYTALRVTGDTGMSSAAGLFQAVVGFALVLSTNIIVKKIDSGYSLF